MWRRFKILAIKIAFDWLKPKVYLQAARFLKSNYSPKEFKLIDFRYSPTLNVIFAKR